MMRPFALIAALSAAINGAAQVPFSIDTSFRLVLDSQNAYDLEFLPGGGLLISGNFDFPNEFPNGIYHRGMLKLNSTGEIDLSYPCCYGQGKIVPWNGRFYTQSGQSLRRVLANGQLDPAFNLIVPDPDPLISPLQGGDYHVFPDGRVLFGGYHDIDDPDHGFYQGVGYNLAWITADGRLDTTRIHRTGNGTVWRIKEYPAGTAGDLGGKFLVHQWGTEYEGQQVGKVIRVHADGSLDDSFNAPIEWGYVYSMEPLPDGRAYLGGTFRLENQTDTIQLIRVMPDGTLDPTFNNAIYMLMGEQFTFLDAGVSCVYPIGDGLLAITGLFSEVDGHDLNGICMLDTAGNVVPYYFTGSGCGSYQHQLGQMVQTYGSIDGIARAPSGDYYIWGAYHGYSDGTSNDTLQRMVTRLHGGEIGLGVPQARVQEQAMRVYPNPASALATLELDALPPDAQLVLRDALGRVVLRQPINGHYTTLQLDAIPTGCFGAELWANGKRAAHHKLIIQR